LQGGQLLSRWFARESGADFDESRRAEGEIACNPEATVEAIEEAVSIAEAAAADEASHDRKQSLREHAKR